MDIDRLDISASRQRATQTLLGGKSNRNDDKLTQLASKQSSDTLKYTHLLLKTRLASELDRTMATQLDKHGLRDQVYIGVITDGGFSAEVVPIDAAANATEGLDADEAQEKLLSNPIGYFKRDDFTLKTPDNPAFQEFKAALDKFFESNGDLFNYLRTNPDANVAMNDLYRPPS